MKTSHFFLILILVLSLTILPGCRTLAAIDRAEDVIEHRIDVAEERVEDALIQNIPVPTISADSVPSEPTPADPTQTISAEEAQAIALEHAGVTEQEVSRLSTRTDWDDGRQEYDVEFFVNYLEYEYEIDASTGSILSFDKDA